MRLLLGSRLTTAALAGVLALALGGCGDDDGEIATDAPTSAPTSETTSAAPSAAPSPTDNPTAESGDSVPQLIELVSATSAGGEVSDQLTSVGDPNDLSTYLGQLTSEDLVADLRDVVEQAQVPDGQDVAMAVVALGCDVPPGVRVEASGSGFTVVAEKVAKPLDNCFAPMTTVAVVQVPG